MIEHDLTVENVELDQETVKLLRELSEYTDRQAVYDPINLALKVREFKERGEDLKSIVQTALIIKALGHRPLLCLALMYFIHQSQKPVTRADIARYLERLFGKCYLRGGPNVELGRVLSALEKLRIIKSNTVRIGRQKRKLFTFNNINLQINSMSLSSLFHDDSDIKIDITQVLSKQYDERIRKIKDYDGKLKNFESAKIVESIIRSGGTFQEAISTLNKIVPKLKTEIEKSELQMLIYHTLLHINKKVAENYKVNYPVKIYVKTGKNTKIPITYSTLSEELILTYLKKTFNICYLSKKSREKISRIVYDSFYECPSQELSSTVSEDRLLEEIELGFFRLFRKDAKTYMAEAASHKTSARYYIRECRRIDPAQRKLSREEKTLRLAKVATNIVEATAHFFLYVMLTNGVIPPPPPRRKTAPYQLTLINFFKTIIFSGKSHSKEVHRARDAIISFLSEKKDSSIIENLKTLCMCTKKLYRTLKEDPNAINYNEVKEIIDFFNNILD